VSSEWTLAKAPLPCSRKGCAGIKPGEWFFLFEDERVSPMPWLQRFARAIGILSASHSAHSQECALRRVHWIVSAPRPQPASCGAGPQFRDFHIAPVSPSSLVEFSGFPVRGGAVLGAYQDHEDSQPDSFWWSYSGVVAPSGRGVLFRGALSSTPIPNSGGLPEIASYPKMSRGKLSAVCPNPGTLTS